MSLFSVRKKIKLLLLETTEDTKAMYGPGLMAAISIIDEELEAGQEQEFLKSIKPNLFTWSDGTPLPSDAEIAAQEGVPI
jgi:hypothetical protein